MSPRWLLPLCVAVGVAACDDPAGPPADPTGRFVEVVAAAAHSCARTEDGRVYCWGDNRTGKLGTGGAEPRYRPAQTALDRPAARLSELPDGTCALVGGALTCWPGSTSLAPLPPEGEREWVRFDGYAAELMCGVTRDARGYCWSWSYDAAPEPLPGDLRWRDISVSGREACGVTQDDVGFCWSWDWNESADGRDEPLVEIEGGHRWQSIERSHGFACGLTVEGELYCWGSNDSGQLGHTPLRPDWETQAAPVRVALEERVVEYSVGADHACAIDWTGDMACWGSDADGKLGTGRLIDEGLPVKIGRRLRWRDVDAGARHTCGVTTAGDVYCWGSNRSLQLGDGTQTDRSLPVQVSFAGD